MRCLALDVGDRRVGVAVSDETGLVVTPLEVLKRASKVEDYARISALMRERKANVLVVGQPLNDDGSQSPQAQRIERYVRALADAVRADGLVCTLVFWDETYSTQRAQELMIAAGRGAKKRKARLDSVAAAVFLKDYLDSRRSAGMGYGEEGAC
jgi:putative Holliday junction resolvase